MTGSCSLSNAYNTGWVCRLTQHGRSFSSHQGLLCKWNLIGLAGKRNASPLYSHTSKQPELRKFQ